MKPMRFVCSHVCSGLNEAIRIEVLDEPGSGGANHRYRTVSCGPHPTSLKDTEIVFQNGPIGEAGVNGLSNEVLLAIVQDRLEGFQRGPFACRENAIALTHVQDALHWLLHRTRDRVQRGAEGKLVK